MPSRFFDYESDLLRFSGKGDKVSTTGFRRSANAQQSRQNSTSEPTSTTSTHTSVSSVNTSGMSPSTWHPGHRVHGSTGNLSQGSHNMRDPNREEQVEPTEQIQAWAHQMHIQQHRQYWWCSSCYPKTPTLHIPSDKAIKKRVRIAEPTHAYE